LSLQSCRWRGGKNCPQPKKEILHHLSLSLRVE
jgi:hypothetical protein